MRIITISREFGSGGRELGKRLADALGFAYYDKEIIATVAEKRSIDAAYLERMTEAGLSPQIPLTFSRTLAHFPPFSPNKIPPALK